MNKSYFFPFCSEQKKKKIKNQLIIAAIINLLLFIALFFYNKIVIVMGSSAVLFFSFYQMKKSCQKYFLSITPDQICYQTPDNEKNCIAVKDITSTEANNRYVRFYLPDKITNVYIIDFDPKIREQIKSYFEKYKF